LSVLKYFKRPIYNFNLKLVEVALSRYHGVIMVVGGEDESKKNICETGK
jgi:hypothetical protein